MKILIVNRFFGGAQIPTGRMAEDVARLLVEEGHEVTALASTGEYVGAAHRADGIRYTAQGIREEGEAAAHSAESDTEPKHRNTASPKHRSTLRVEQVRVPKWMPRALAWVWFTWQARKCIPRMDWDVCVLMTDPPLLPLLAARAKAAERLRGCGTTGPQDATRRVTVWLMDLYPEALAASGRIAKSNPLYKWYFHKRQKALSSCDLLVCLGEAQKALVDAGCIRQTANSIRPTRIAVVPPWDDRGNIALATEESLKNLALYAGNLGEAHCFEEILAAAPYLPGDWTIRFAARGAKLSALRAKASHREFSHGLRGLNTDGVRAAAPTGLRGSAHAVGLPKGHLRFTALAVSPPSEEVISRGCAVEITGYASEEETPGLLASARVHLITMSPGWEGIVVPSKLYGCIRTGRPVLFIGPENADTAREIRAHDWGKVLPPGVSGEEVAAAILELAARETCAVLPQRRAAAVAKLIQSLATDGHG